MNTSINKGGSKVYELSGPLFFGSIASFQDLFDPKGDPDDVIIDFMRSRVVDHSALEAIDSLGVRYTNAGKRLHLLHLSEDCHKLLHKSGSLVEVSTIDDPHYGIAVDYSEEFKEEISKT